MAETELGAVKFTKPVAYQEIDGKRVAVAVEYRIQESGDGSQKSELNPKSTNSDSKNLKSEIENLSSTQTCPRLREGIGEPQLDKAEFARKTKKLQIPFIANNGQVDEQVRFYAKTFGGTVFVTKNGEIVYSLPNNSSELGAESLKSDGRRQRSEARIQECRGE